MGKKLVLKMNETSLFNVMYPYVSKKKFTQLTKPSTTKILSMNYFILSKNLPIHMLIKENMAINIITNIKLILFN